MKYIDIYKDIEKQLLKYRRDVYRGGDELWDALARIGTQIIDFMDKEEVSSFEVGFAGIIHNVTMLINNKTNYNEAYRLLCKLDQLCRAAENIRYLPSDLELDCGGDRQEYIARVDDMLKKANSERDASSTLRKVIDEAIILNSMTEDVNAGTRDSHLRWLSYNMHDLGDNEVHNTASYTFTEIKQELNKQEQPSYLDNDVTSFGLLTPDNHMKALRDGRMVDYLEEIEDALEEALRLGGTREQARDIFAELFHLATLLEARRKDLYEGALGKLWGRSLSMALGEVYVELHQIFKNMKDIVIFGLTKDNSDETNTSAIKNEASELVNELGGLFAQAGEELDSYTPYKVIIPKLLLLNSMSRESEEVIKDRELHLRHWDSTMYVHTVSEVDSALGTYFNDLVQAVGGMESKAVIKPMNLFGATSTLEEASTQPTNENAKNVVLKEIGILLHDISEDKDLHESLNNFRTTLRSTGLWED